MLEISSYSLGFNSLVRLEDARNGSRNESKKTLTGPNTYRLIHKDIVFECADGKFVIIIKK